MSARDHRSVRKKRGAALVLTLALLAVAVAMALQYLALSASSRRSLTAQLDRLAIRAVAADAALRACQRLADDEDLQCDHRDEPWALPESFVTPEGIRVDLRIEDASGRFNVNNLAAPLPADREISREVIQEISRLSAHPAPTRAAAGLRDALDADAEGEYERPPPETAEGRKIVRPINRALASPVEWWRIPDWDRDTVERRPELPGGGVGPSVADLTSIIPGVPRHPEPVNVNFAREETLAALFGSSRRALAAGMVSLRNAAPMRNLNAIAALADPIRMNLLRPFLDVRTRHFRITVRAESADRLVRLTAWVERDAGGRVRILRWVW